MARVAKSATALAVLWAIGLIAARSMEIDGRQPSLARSAEGAVRFCLLGERHCMGLEEAPFTVCELSTARCPQDVELENLVFAKR